ncbi:MAG: hypothetical protein IPM92_12230 [Saprospiraceae bacterium]|nr:hypothetical protein [Saprospiraceae bacterium]
MIESSITAPDYIRIHRKGMESKILLKISENTFAPTGAPSVKILFEVKENKVISFTIYETEPMVTAVKI